MIKSTALKNVSQAYSVTNQLKYNINNRTEKLHYISNLLPGIVTAVPSHQSLVILTTQYVKNYLSKKNTSAKSTIAYISI